MEFLYEYLFFFAKVATFAITIILTMLAAVAVASKGKGGDKSKSKIKISKLNDKYSELAKKIEQEVLSKKEFKAKSKEKDKNNKKEKKNIFFLEFKGDIRASSVDQLREQVSAILQVANTQDEVVINIESPGGLVPHYGLAASQLVRIREKAIPLTVCIDKIAASGGYLMATVANTILTAPFAIVGSIGVVAQLPNFHRLLKKSYIDYEEPTAGKYKRTLTNFGEITNERREKFQESLEEVHDLFKGHIVKYRPSINIDDVSNGDYWHGAHAVKLQLVDKIMTSDDYLLTQLESANIYHIYSDVKKSFVERFTNSTQALAENFNISLQ